LKQHHKSNDVIAVAVWTVQDVLDRAKELHTRITKSEAEEILEAVHHRQYASGGINWDMIDAGIGTKSW
jgi:hypothetical protein